MAYKARPTQTRVPVRGSIGKRVPLPQAQLAAATATANAALAAVTALGVTVDLPAGFGGSTAPLPIYWQQIQYVPPNVRYAPIFMQADDPEDGGAVVPGPAGKAGSAGSAGATGPPGQGLPLWIDPPDPDDPLVIPGVPGPIGNTGATGGPGATGLPGATGFALELDYEDHVPFPGPSGPVGPSGPTGGAGPAGQGGNAAMANFLDWENDDAVVPQPPFPFIFTAERYAGAAGASAYGLMIGPSVSQLTGNACALSLLTVNGGGFFSGDVGMQVPASTSDLKLYNNTTSGGILLATKSGSGSSTTYLSVSGGNTVSTLVASAGTFKWQQAGGTLLATMNYDGGFTVGSGTGVNTDLGAGTINAAAQINSATVHTVGKAPLIVNMARPELDYEYPEENALIGIALSLLGSQNQWLATNNFYHSIACFNGVGGATLFQAGAQTTSPTVQGYGPTAAALVDMTPDTGSFTGTFTGLTTSPTTTCYFARMGNLVVLYLGTMTGTSNATSFTMTGLPASLQPARQQYLPTPSEAFENASVGLLDNADVVINAASGTVVFVYNGSSTGWTSSGTKAIQFPFTVAYLLN